MGSTALYLAALQCPHAADFSAEVFEDQDRAFVRRLVLWLENQKIRQYPVSEREGLRSADLPSWEAAFGQYLKDLSCPYTYASLSHAVQWLCSRAGTSFCVRALFVFEALQDGCYRGRLLFIRRQP